MLALVTALWLAQAPAPADAPLREEQSRLAVESYAPAAEQPRVPFAPIPLYKRHRSWLLPAIQSEAFHLAFLAFNSLVSRAEFAMLSLDSTVSHFDGRRPLEWDVDSFAVNQFGHPYQGALAYTAARSSGHSFWTAILFPIIASLTWELFYEVDAPSFNDQITTPIGGIFLGEVLIRASRLLLDYDVGGGWPHVARQAGAFILDPVGTLNRLAFDGAYDPGDVERLPPHFAWLSAGVNLGSVARNPATLETEQTTGLQGRAQVRLIYGPPGDPRFGYSTPFSHFDLELVVQAPEPLTLQLFTKGLLLGQQFGSASSKLRGLWGLFGQYDFSIASLVRISAVAFGPGVALQANLGGDWYFHFNSTIGGVPFASAGSVGLEGVEGVRDYHIGPGVHFFAEWRLTNREWGWLRVAGREWFTFGVYTPPNGWESVTYLTAGPMVRLASRIGITAEVNVSLRRSYFADATFDRKVNAYSLAVSLLYLSGDGFGVVEPAHELR